MNSLITDGSRRSISDVSRQTLSSSTHLSQRHRSLSSASRHLSTGEDNNALNASGSLSRLVDPSYPRTVSLAETKSYLSIATLFKKLKNSETSQSKVIINGRITSIRRASSKLAFITLINNGWHMQAMCSFQALLGESAESAIDIAQFSAAISQLNRGDSLRIVGNPYRTQTGELSIKAIELPVVLSQNLHNIPPQLENKELRMRSRHVDLMVNPRSIQLLRLRSHIIKLLRLFFGTQGFVEVQTPLLNDLAGGAVARPFQTNATEFRDRELSLRIAPELWLKRLVLGGMEQIYEIGPAFRNEGIDGTHNPEFTVCEFYRAYASLEDLVSTTQDMLHDIVARLELQWRHIAPDVVQPSLSLPKKFQRLKFIPTVENLIGEKLPDLEAANACEQLVRLFEKRKWQLPATATLPRLLDKLSSDILEPLCEEPTFITHHPAVLAPLAKSTIEDGQHVSLRFELIVKGREIANAYEEENSPEAQRRKFEAQLKHRVGHGSAAVVDEEVATSIDESYISALEWGLPPTGGWGMGIDRLVMLLTGAERIEDVLTFGTLRHVLAAR
jgi:lysyl-tRNA synthetase class 2